MKLDCGKNNIQIYRNSWRDFSVNRNIGTGRIDRLDRDALGIAFIELRLGRIVVAFYRELRPIPVQGVGQRGVW